ncbi:MAG: DUF1801 domain-containing protein, partial [Saprospiraceae bacterium]|nr:DUF1801 domain-containing protein [Saprospiraceae bacterium]
MQSKATTVEDYLAELPEDRKEAMTMLRKIIKKNLPKGFQECMGYGMMGYSISSFSLSFRFTTATHKQPLP